MANRSTDVDHLVGRTVGRRRYEVVARIAQGGMATVYRAHDRQLDRVVALKVPRPELARDRAFCEQFRREARAAARLAHPNVVAVHDSGEERGLPWIVMELVEGQTLRALLEARGRLDPETTAALLGEVSDGLDHAHRHGVVHLDVKPENVLLTADSVKVADFGLVRAVQGARDHAPAGTAQYCAPEVLRGGVVDARADVYSLGVVAYECLTGRSPFGQGDAARVVWQVLHGRVPVPSRTVPGLAEAVDAAVWRATEPDPARRFQRTSDVAAAMGAPRRRPFDQALATAALLSSTLATTVEVGTAAGAAADAAAPPRSGRSGRWSRSGRAGGWVVVLLVLALLLAGGALVWDNFVVSSVSVPNLVGENLRQAKSALALKHLKVVVGRPVPSGTVAQGRVAEQSPGPGGAVRRWTTVRLLPSSGIVLPDLKGQAVARAEEALSNLGLRWKEVSRPSATVPAGLVAGTRPRAGVPIGASQQVEVDVSAGTPPVEVPGVNGQPLDAAAAALRQAGFRVATAQVFADSVAAGNVVSTSPPAGVQATWGSTVQVYVSKGPDLVEVPDVRDLSKAEAEAVLSARGLRWQYSFGFGKTVSGQDPEPGSKVARNTVVALSVSLF